MAWIVDVVISGSQLVAVAEFRGDRGSINLTVLGKDRALGTDQQPTEIAL